MKLYDELAEWWPLLSPTEDYLEEAQELLALVDRLARQPVHRLLELGCGGGSLAHQLRDRFDLTLSDRSPAMVRESRRLNPDCEHVVADMRTIDLDRRFDAVLIHDAVMYLTGRADLRAAFEAARRHLHPEGLLVVMPDVVKERFEPGTDHGGHDGPDGRGLRYLEWRHDRDS
ncbi:MAG: class I SAM-dependent methyltransferase, partial [Planctomycetes bacterium]|nr:class I SAM-dependent methyltransferase [Planctomycetota bacterium]